MKKLYGFIFATALVPVSVQAAVDFGKINALFEAITKQVVALEQEKDADGNELLDHLKASFDKASDLDKGKFAFTASAGIRTSRWAPGKNSSLALTLKASQFDLPTGTQSLLATLKVDLKTQTTELARYATAELIKSQDPCSDHAIKGNAESPAEETFNQVYCDEVTKISKAAKFEDVLSSLETILQKRIAYVDTRLAQLATGNNKFLVQSLTEERKYEMEGLKAFKARGTTGKVTLTYQEKKGVYKYGETALTEVALSLASDGVDVTITFESPEGAATLAGYKTEIEKLASVLAGDVTDPATKDVADNLTKSLREYVQLAKALLFK